MDSNAAAVLQNLADKLGTTSEYLWAVLIKQASISAIMSGLWTVAAMAAVLTFLWFVPRSIKALDDYKTEGSAMTYLIFGGIVAVIAALSIVLSISTLVTALLNPEYWALKQVLSAIRGVR